MAGMKRGTKRIIGGCAAAAAVVWIGIGVVNLCASPANLTRGFAKKQREYAHPRREFSARFEGNHAIFEGSYVGAEKYWGRTYHHVQFPGVLEGEGRYLDVLFPETVMEQAVIFESGRRIESSRFAFLLLELFCCLEMEVGEALRSQEEGVSSDPARFMKEHLGFETGEVGEQVVLCEMDLTNVFNHTTMCIMWDGGRVVARGGSVVVPYEMELEWRVRSPGGFMARKLWYAATVLADVVTGPLQLAFWLIVGPRMVM